MTEPAPTRTVEAIAPFVERALDSRDAREALAEPRLSGDEPGGEDGGNRWAAAQHAGERVSEPHHMSH